MFLNPTMLAGIGGASLPLVLHLLARARYRTVDWGAMMFLEARDPRAAASARLKGELYSVTDRQAASWKNLESGGGTLQWISDEQHHTHFYVIPVGGEDAENVSIESVELVEPVAVRNQSAEVEVKVRNYGSSP